MPQTQLGSSFFLRMYIQADAFPRCICGARWWCAVFFHFTETLHERCIYCSFHPPVQHHPSSSSSRQAATQSHKKRQLNPLPSMSVVLLCLSNAPDAPLMLTVTRPNSGTCVTRTAHTPNCCELTHVCFSRGCCDLPESLSRTHTHTHAVRVTGNS